MIDPEGFVVLQDNVGQNGRQKKVTAQLGMNDQRVLREPTQACELSEFSFQQRGGVHNTSRATARDLLPDQSYKRSQLDVNYVMVITISPGVSRDLAFSRADAGHFIRAVI
jgi:hypothetical protein